MRQSYRPAGMRGLAIEPFSGEHLDAAAELLAARHARHRRVEPLLPARFEEPSAARTEVEALWHAHDATGAVAVRDGRMVGYVIGAGKGEDIWGPNVWVEPAGLAFEEPEVARDLYAALAADWVGAGRTRHYVQVPASEEALVESWFRVGFGQQQAHGVRELDAQRVEASHVTVREAGEADVDALVALAPVLAHHQQRSPVFSGRPVTETDDEIREDIVKDLTDGSIGNLVAEADGRIVSNFVLAPVEHSSMHTSLARPEGAALLGWAATQPQARGSGAGLALMDASLAWARDRGYSSMVTDWRVTNLLASRFWPRRGFRETFLRLHRSIP
jgi:GNAT superfamily N-acetyltransferase